MHERRWCFVYVTCSSRVPSKKPTSQRGAVEACRAFAALSLLQRAQFSRRELNRRLDAFERSSIANLMIFSVRPPILRSLRTETGRASAAINHINWTSSLACKELERATTQMPRCSYIHIHTRHTRTWHNLHSNIKAPRHGLRSSTHSITPALITTCD